MKNLNQTPEREKMNDTLTVYGYQAPPQPLMVYGFDLRQAPRFRYTPGTWRREVEEAIWEHERREGGPKLFHGRNVWEVVGKLEEAFKSGCTNPEACTDAEITEDQYYYFVKDKPELSKHFKLLKDNVQVIKARKTVDKALETDPGMAIKFLEKKRKQEFGNSTDINLNMSGQFNSINAQLIAIKTEFDKRLINSINQADLNGEIPPSSDDYQIPPPQKLLDQTFTKEIDSEKQEAPVGKSGS